MTRAEARTAIKTATDHDGVLDTQVTDTQLNAWIDTEHKLFRRELSQIVPSLYAATDEEQTLDSSLEEDSLSLPDDYERLVRVEKQAGSVWYPVDISDELNPHTGTLVVREEGTDLVVSPATQTSGTYRIVYVQKPATMGSDSATLDVPDGCEGIVVERVCALVRVRLDEDATPHQQRALALWTEQKKYLRRRYGKSPQPGLRLARRW